jgi:hypothetical protein
MESHTGAILSMSSFLTDPRYLAPIVTSSGIAVSLVLWILNLRTKEMAFEILTNTPLFSVQEEVKDQVQISFQGQPVHDVNLVLVKLVNTGNVPIRAQEFAGRFALSCPSETKVLLAEVMATNPPDLNQRLAPSESNSSIVDRIEGSDVLLKPILLNAKDSITLKLLVTPSIDTIKVSAHVEGMATIKKSKENRFAPIFLANMGAFIMAVSLFFLDPSAIFSNKSILYVPYLIFFLLGYVMLLSGVYLPKMNKKSIGKALRMSA